MTQDFYLQSEDKVDAFQAIFEMQVVLEQLRARLPKTFERLLINETYLYHLFRTVCESLAKRGENRVLADEGSMRSYTLEGPDGVPLLKVHIQEQENSEEFSLNEAVMYDDSCPACREINAARKAALNVESEDVDVGSA